MTRFEVDDRGLWEVEGPNRSGVTTRSLVSPPLPEAVETAKEARWGRVLGWFKSATTPARSRK